MRDKCNKCIYSCSVDVGDDCEMLRACIYILLRGVRRPCRPGAGCTAFEPVPKWGRPRCL